MSKKRLLAGIFLGSVTTAASWALLPAEKRQKLQEQTNDAVHNIADQATDYALNALDIVDGRLADMGGSDVTDNIKNAGEKVKEKKDQVVDHLTNDEFDEQTAEIRDQLAKEKASEAADNGDDDIVIDNTDAKRPNDEE